LEVIFCIFWKDKYHKFNIAGFCYLFPYITYGIF